MAHGHMLGLVKLVVPTTAGLASSPILSLTAFGKIYLFCKIQFFLGKRREHLRNSIYFRNSSNSEKTGIRENSKMKKHALPKS
jgi:hypothetical protein